MIGKAAILATIGPSTKDKDTIGKMINEGMGLARLNFSWGTYAEHSGYIKNIREVALELGKKIPIIQDLSGPRMPDNIAGHRFNPSAEEIITEKDLADLKFGTEQNVDYVAMSYVGNKDDILNLRSKMKKIGKVIPIISKVEREVAVQKLDEIILISDGIMVARGDLGNEVPLEQIPFVQEDIVKKCKKAGKPVIVATEVMLSMMNKPNPSRAEATDVAFAVLNGADVIMLSEETAIGKYPVETIRAMRKGIDEATKHLKEAKINSF